MTNGRALAATDRPLPKMLPISVRDLDLEGWTPSQTLPQKVVDRPALLTSAMRAAAEANLPASPNEFAQAVTELVSFARTFNIAVADVKAAGAYYFETLGGLPKDMMEEAFRRARTAPIWFNRLPMPSDILKLIDHERAEQLKTIRTFSLAVMVLERMAEVGAGHMERQRSTDHYIRSLGKSRGGEAAKPEPEIDEISEAARAEKIAECEALVTQS